MKFKKMISKAAAVVLSLCMVVGIMGDAPAFLGDLFTANAEEEQIYGDFTYIDKGDYIEITGLIPETIEAIKNAPKTETSKKEWLIGCFGITIPEYIYGKPVTSIGTKAFNINMNYNPNMDYSGQYIIVKIPRLINSIAKDAFASKFFDSQYIRFTPQMELMYLNAGESQKCPAINCLIDIYKDWYKEYHYELQGYNENGEIIDIFTAQSFGFDGSSITESNLMDKTGKNVIYDKGNEIITASKETPGGFKYSVLFNETPWHSLFEIVTTNDSYQYNLGYSLNELYENEGQTKPMKIDTSYHFSHDLNYLFDKSYSTSYNPELANMLCVISQSAYKRIAISLDYLKLGFNSFEIQDYDTTYTQEDNCGYVIGYQDLDDGTREFLITVRGTPIDSINEWLSDLNLGSNVYSDVYRYPKYHYGFYQAAQRIYESLKKYNNGSIQTENVRYVLTGHSRGAAVSNIVSSWLINDGVSKNNLYSYNFACPGVSIDRESSFSANKYSSIFNINCARDLVGQAPGTLLSATTSSFWGSLCDEEVANWGKYGMTYFWDRDWDSVKLPSVTELSEYHPCDTNYIPYLSNQPTLNEFKNYYDMRQIQWRNYIKEKAIKAGLGAVGIHVFTGTITKQIWIAPPLESNVSNLAVSVSDATGKTLATVIDNIVKIEDPVINDIQMQVIDGRVELSIDANEEYNVTVQSEEPLTIGVAQGNAAYNSVNNGAVYNTDSGNVTISITPETPATELPVADSDGNKIAPDKIWLLGDANSDGKVGVADAVVLQKWLLGMPDSELAEWTAADIYEDNRLDAFDMVLMRQLITQ